MIQDKHARLSWLQQYLLEVLCSYDSTKIVFVIWGRKFILHNTPPPEYSEDSGACFFFYWFYCIPCLIPSFSVSHHPHLWAEFLILYQRQSSLSRPYCLFLENLRFCYESWLTCSGGADSMMSSVLVFKWLSFIIVLLFWISSF